MWKPNSRVVLALFAASLALAPANADVKIILKDGRMISVPVDPQEIQSINMEPGRTSTPALPPTPGLSSLPSQPSFKPNAPGAPNGTPPTATPPNSAPVQAKAPAPETVQPAATPGRIQVGPNREIKLPSRAAGLAKAGDVIEIDAGTYRGDVASWRADNLTIRGVGGRVRLVADGVSAEDKAIWVIKGRNTVVENIEFTGAAVNDGNGAGIRAEGTDLKIFNCYFHDNQEGILVAIDTPDSVIQIENSEFARNGGNEGRSHHIYISAIRQLIVRGSYFHQGRIGHLIKSRAKLNLIEGNRITDENGTASYEIDIPNGGRTYIIGNLIEKNPGADNNTLVAYALEGPTNDNQELYVVNNTFVNNVGQGIFIFSRAPVPAKVINNIFIGGGNVFRGTGELKNNMLAPGRGGAPKVEQALFTSGDLKEEGTKAVGDAGLADIGKFDFRLKAGSPAIDAGADPGSGGGVSLVPTLEYVHPTQSKTVRATKPYDIGAYQFAN